MTIPVGITQVNDVFGVAYARIMAAALLAAHAGRGRLPDLPAPRDRGGDDLLRRQRLTMTKRPYTGIWPVAPTPFADDGALDLDGMKRVIDCMVDQGVDGICILANFSEQFLLVGRGAQGR